MWTPSRSLRYSIAVECVNHSKWQSTDLVRVSLGSAKRDIVSEKCCKRGRKLVNPGLTEEGKLKVACKVCKKDVLVGDTKHSHLQNLKAHLDSREHQLQLAILENEEEYPTSITASFREIDQAFPRMFLLTPKGAFCRV